MSKVFLAITGVSKVWKGKLILILSKGDDDGKRRANSGYFTFNLFFSFVLGIDSSAMQIPIPILHNKQIR